MSSIRSLLNSLIHPARIGIVARNLSTENEFSYSENEVFGTASVIKIAIALTLFKLAQQKKLDLYKTRVIKNEDIFDNGLNDCGVLKQFYRKNGISLYNACLLMLALSDNTATNLVLRYVTAKAVNAFLTTNDFQKTRLTVETLSTKLLIAPTNFVGDSTPRETFALLEGLVNSTFVKKTYSEAILKMMSLQQITHKIPRSLPSVRNVVEKNAEIVDISSKTGEISCAGINNDVAIITTENDEKIILVIYTQNIPDDVKTIKVAAIDSASSQFIAKLAKELYKKLRK